MQFYVNILDYYKLRRKSWKTDLLPKKLMRKCSLRKAVVKLLSDVLSVAESWLDWGLTSLKSLNSTHGWKDEHFFFFKWKTAPSFEHFFILVYLNLSGCDTALKLGLYQTVRKDCISPPNRTKALCNVGNGSYIYCLVCFIGDSIREIRVPDWTFSINCWNDNWPLLSAKLPANSFFQWTHFSFNSTLNVVIVFVLCNLYTTSAQKGYEARSTST